MGPSIYIPYLDTGTIRFRRLLLTLLVSFSSSFAAITTFAAPSVVPEDIAYKSPESAGGAPDVRVGTAEIPGAETAQASPAADAQQTRYLTSNLCADHSGNHINLQKSVAITRFLRSTPQSTTGGNLFAIEAELPAIIRSELGDKYQTISAGVMPYGFAAPDLTDTQLQQQAQKIARQARSQFVLSGTINDMSMTNPGATYNPSLYRQAANVVHDVTRIKMFDKRTRGIQLSVQLRDGFTGELLFNKEYSTAGIWNERKPVGFNSPAFYRTDYGKNIKALTQTISRDVAEVVHCQPFMASIDSQPGQAQILLHGGANNGLHAGDTLSLYQVIVVGSSTEYQVNETRLVKRDTRLHLREVYPSHSVAQVEGGSYLNGHYLAVGD